MSITTTFGTKRTTVELQIATRKYGSDFPGKVPQVEEAHEMLAAVELVVVYSLF